MSEMNYTGHEEEDEDGFEMAAVYDMGDKSRYLDSIGGVEDEPPRAKSTKEVLEQNLQFVFGETLSIATVAKNEPIKVPEGYNPFKHSSGADIPSLVPAKKKTMAEEILEEQAKRFQ